MHKNMKINSKNTKEAIPKKYHYAKGDVSLSFDLRTDGTFQLKGFLELLKLAQKEVEEKLNSSFLEECTHLPINGIERKHELKKRFYYIKNKISLDFTLRVDRYDTELKNFLGLLNSAVEEVEEDIKLLK